MRGQTAASWASTRGNDVKASAQLLPHVEVKGVKGARGATFTDCLLPSLTLRDVEFSGPVAFKYCLIVRCRACRGPAQPAQRGSRAAAAQADSVFDGVSFPRGVTFLNCKFTASVVRAIACARLLHTSTDSLSLSLLLSPGPAAPVSALRLWRQVSRARLRGGVARVVVKLRVQRPLRRHEHGALLTSGKVGVACGVGGTG